MTEVQREDAERIATSELVPWEDFDGTTVVVTGATGLIGKALVGTLLERERRVGAGTRVVALVRNVRKARELFGEPACLEVVPWDAWRPIENLDKVLAADHIFHCANMTDSASFVERPVDVILTTFKSTEALLELALRTGAGFCQLSTMEVYGEVAKDGALGEDEGGFLDSMNVRNSYPEAKRLDEALCAAYASQHGVHAVVVRLAQTFGPGVPKDDGRVFAYFARCATGGEDIVLLTDGTKSNSYLYTADAVSALLVAASRGRAGGAYNAANDDTFCMVRDMGRLVLERFGSPGARVRIQIDEEASRRFRKGSVLRLDTSRLRDLGWRPVTGLADMFSRMIDDWRER